MDARKAELERKRAKLAELRAARESRRKALEAAQSRDLSTGRSDVEDLVHRLVGSRSSSSSTAASSSGSSDQASGSSPTSGSPSGKRYDPHRLSTSSLLSDMSDNTTTTSSGGHGYTSIPQGGRSIPEFTAVDTVIFDIPPKDRVMYSKEAQTTEDFWERPDPEETEREIQARIQAELDRDAEERRAAQEEDRRRKQAEEAAAIRELTEEEAEAVIRSDHFIEFVDQSARLIERALNEEYDFLTDYTLLQEEDADMDSGSQVKLVADFYDERLCRNRSVMDISWSQKHPELCVAAYNKNPMALDETDGLVLVWNTHLRERPEFTFHSPSDVLTAQFSPFHPNLIIGGTYAGQILLWDTRARALPVLKTPLSSVGHTHPIYAMDVVGTQNAHNLISASTDGLVCSWQLDMLAQPQETLELLHQSHPRTDEVAVMSMGFPDNETTTFWVGTEEGCIYQANRYDRAGNKAGIHPHEVYRGHHGSITGLHFHPLVGPIDFSDLYLTSSVDWTVKLWRSSSVSKSSGGNASSSTASGVADDSVYDVAWSPTHPALFASVDGTGRLDLWNLNQDTEAPIVSTLVGEGKVRALNKLSWDKEGRRVATGGLGSHVWVYDLGTELATPRAEEWSLLQKTLSDMALSPSRDQASHLNVGPGGPGGMGR
ncbi:MAG: WD40-repeat-containing domain protein [Piptocephalis tieghemiana]|nr:MAG: WD40-repeat-containing domain protein [Piptocephalis tieghemiana]